MATAAAATAVARRPSTPPPAPTRGTGLALNPTEYKAEFRDLMAVNPALAADSATKLAVTKKSLERELNAAEESTIDIGAFLLSSGLVALVGFYDGTVMAKRDAIITSWELGQLIPEGTEPPSSMWKDQKVREPGKVWIFSTQFLIASAFAAVAVLRASMRDESDRAGLFERTMAVAATSTFGLWIASMTRSSGFNWQNNRALTAGTGGNAQTGT